MKILDRYILNEFLTAFLYILAVFVVILMMREVLSDLTDLLEEGGGLHYIVMYFISKLPEQIVEVAPITTALAMMFSVGALSKRKELLAIHASGVSYTRMARPLAVAMAAITVFVFLGNETIVPRSEAYARYLEKVKIPNEPESVLTHNRNVTTKGAGNRFYTMRSFDAHTNTMEEPTITDCTEDGRTFRLRIDAERAVLVTRDAPTSTAESAEDEVQLLLQGMRDADGAAGGDASSPRKRQHYWRFYNAACRILDENTGGIRYDFHETVDLPMEDDLDRFLATNKRVDEMNFVELRDYLAVRGRQPGPEYRNSKALLHGKLAFPMAALLLGMLAYTFAVRAGVHSLVMQFGLSLLTIVLYYLTMAACQKFARLGVMPPVISAWFTNALFLALLFWRFRELERVPAR